MNLDARESTSDVGWYAVLARPKQEQRAAMNLLSSGVTTFLPVIRHTTPTGSISPAPLFPQYLFVRCDIFQWARKIQYTRGVARVLGTSDGPTPIADEIIDVIQDRVDDNGFVELTEAFKVGDAVEVTAGPLKGLVGVFHAATSGAQRVVLLLNAVNGQMRATVDTMAVRRAAV